MLDLNAARVFATVVEARSFTRAARRLDMPKSTVSRRVAELEEQLGTRLLQRTTRTLSLTDEGAAYYGRVAEALALLDDAEGLLREAREVPRGTLRLTAPVDLGGRFLGHLLDGFLAAYPEVTVSLELSQRRVDLVGEGVDVALRAGAAPADSSLVMRKVAETPLALFASPAYLACAGRPRALRELAQHRCLRFRAQPVWKLRGPEGEVEVAVRGRVACNDFGFLAAMAVLGGGVALLPMATGAIEERAGRLERVLPAYEAQPGALYLVFPSSRHLTPKVRAFVDFTVERGPELLSSASGAAAGV